MNIWEAILQGIVQGFTEFLPVSSSGHVSLVQHFLGKNIEGAQAFTLFLHFGTLAAVFVVYRQIIWDLIVELCATIKDGAHDLWGLIRYGKGKFELNASWKPTEMNETRRMGMLIIVSCMCAILLFVPVFGFLGLTTASGEEVKTMTDLSQYTSEDSDIIVEGLCLLVTGFLLLYATNAANRRRSTGDITDGEVTLKTAIIMGIGQCFATLPGLSRSGTTTSLGMIHRADKNKALQFSFIMGIPAVLAGNVLEIATMTDEQWDKFEVLPVLIGVIFAAVVGILSIFGLRWIVSNNKLNYFGYYCLAMGALVIIIAIIEKTTGCGNAVPAAELLGEVTSTDVSAADLVASLADVA